MIRKLLLLSIIMSSVGMIAQEEPLKIGVAGLTHTHVHWIFESDKQHDEFEIVGIAEPNRELAQMYAEQHGFSMDLVYDSLDEMIHEEKPEVVTAFGTIREHLGVVEACAPKGIHVMVEKPLAVSLEHAKRMEQLAEDHKIHLLTNYETTWYPTNHRAYELAVNKDSIGEIRKVIVRDGHRGPKKIGINKEFLDWLTDPDENGGGALPDFGCYGANLMTWLMEGSAPKRVTAMTQQLQPENNPEVEDEAIILLDYGNANAIIQASWNWPIGRKDMEVYGTTGAIYADNRYKLRLRLPVDYDGFEEIEEDLDERATPYSDPFVYFAAVIRGAIEIQPSDLSALENNMTVMRILDAAIRSAREGRTIQLK